MIGSEKQQEWAKRLYKQLYDGYQAVEAKLATPEADAWKKAYEYGQKLVDDYAKENRAWVIIDALKNLSKDAEKAARQVRYMANHQNAEEQKAEV